MTNLRPFRTLGVTSLVVVMFLASCGPHNRAPSVKDLRNDAAVVAIVSDEPIYITDVQQEAEAQSLVKRVSPYHLIRRCFRACWRSWSIKSCWRKRL